MLEKRFPALPRRFRNIPGLGPYFTVGFVVMASRQNVFQAPEGPRARAAPGLTVVLGPELPKKRGKPLVVLILALLLAGAAAGFLFRKPVILVTDSAFHSLYGRNRSLVRQITLSVVLFRQVKGVMVAETSGPDMISLAVRRASVRPYAVFFPYRYREGARRYLKDQPGTPAVVLADREMPEFAGGETGLSPAWFSTDTELDYYRAGYGAGSLAYERRDVSRTRRREILVFQDEDRRSRDQEAFSRGLNDFWKAKTGSPYDGNLVFPGYSWTASADFPQNTDCIVISGIGDVFFRAKKEDFASVPLVFFTWLDPEALPYETALVFDDSPWALLPGAVRTLKRGRGRIPSEIHLLPGGLPVILGWRIKTLNIPARTADN